LAAAEALFSQPTALDVQQAEAEAQAAGGEGSAD
jgi:hypothetical protein